MAKRLDCFLFEQEMVKSRSSAKDLILRGNVQVNGKQIYKPAFSLKESDDVVLLETSKYVGRGGEKLAKALSVFSINPLGKTALDIGASTGGFVDCLLQNGAKKVYALDVGHGQLAEELRDDLRVCNLEGKDIRDLTFSELDDIVPDLISSDVSFISLSLIFPSIYQFSSSDTDIICLVKPQFEIGKTSKGIVRNKKDHLAVLKQVSASAERCQLGVVNADFSPIKGGKGNIEYLFYLKKNGVSHTIDFRSIVETAHRYSMG